MTVYLPFVLLAALLVVGALALVLPPLFGAGLQRRRAAADVSAEAGQAATALAVLREQLADLDADRAAGRIDDEVYARSRDELEKRALDEGEAAAASVEARPARSWAAALAVTVPALAVAIYLLLGNPDGLDPQKAGGDEAFSQAQIAEMVNGLAVRLEKEPENAEGWMMLARSYVVMKDWGKAAGAYAKLAALRPGNADILADWADVVAAEHGSVVGPAEPIIAQALAANPDHVKSLLLLGTAAFERHDYAAAANHWERVLAHVGPDEGIAQELREGINEARAMAGMKPLEASAAVPAAAQAAPAAAAAGSGLTLSGRLEVAAALGGQLGADDVVFVFVRAGAAGGPPVAALRFKGSELPADFSFDGVPRMSGEGPLPAQVSVVARVSKSGDVTPRPGDLEGRVDGVAPAAKGVALRIDKVRE